MIVGTDFNFIHIMKTGGTWMQRACEQVPKRVLWKSAHNPYDALSSVDAGRPTFAMIRNPWDWHVSMYHYMHAKAQRNPKMHTPHRELYLQSFESVIRSESAAKYQLAKHVENMTFREDGLHELIQWRRFEEGVLPVLLEMLESTGGVLEEQERYQIERVGAVNVSQHKPYQEYYTNELRELVWEKEAPVIERWKYEF